MKFENFKSKTCPAQEIVDKLIAKWKNKNREHYLLNALMVSFINFFRLSPKLLVKMQRNHLFMVVDEVEQYYI
jgi:hypothetical protein